MCRNNQAPTREVVSVGVLIHAMVIDPFSALPDTMKEQAVSLPLSETSTYASGRHGRRHRQPKGLLEQLLSP